MKKNCAPKKSSRNPSPAMLEELRAERRNAIRAYAAWADDHPDATDGELDAAHQAVDAATAAYRAAKSAAGAGSGSGSAEVVVAVRANPGEAPSYAASHWGIKPRTSRGTTMDVPDPNVNIRAAKVSGKPPFVELGTLVSIVYCTSKQGDPDLTEYEHKFEHEHPVLCYGRKDGRLYIVGGTYTMEPRGIVR
jgi:hypothetical protein